MGTNISSGTVTATILANDADEELTLLSGSRTTAGTTTLGTVGAGKVWRIYAASLSNWESTTTFGTGRLLFDTTPILSTSSRVVTSGGIATNMGFVHFGAGKYVTLAATKTVTLVTAGNDMDHDAWIVYKEVDA